MNFFRMTDGFCGKGTDVTVKLKGGDLTASDSDERVILSGDAHLVSSGTVEY